MFFWEAPELLSLAANVLAQGIKSFYLRAELILCLDTARIFCRVTITKYSLR
jgi:hypothetical protein